MKIGYIVLLGILIATSSCQKDFLDQVPDDKLSMDQVFDRKDLSEEFLANIYHYLGYAMPHQQANPWEGLSDEEDITYNRPGQSAFATYQMNLGDWTPSSHFYDTWTPYYEAIRSASYFINHIGSNKQILDLPGGNSLIKQYTAEARFLRAFYYFALLRQYGPIIILGDNPIPVDEPTASPLLNLPRNTYDSCVNYIVDQLDLAAQDLPLNFTNQSNLDYGRATAAACMAVKSRLLLYAASPQFNGNTGYSQFKNKDGTRLINQQYDKEKWKRAADAAKDVIDLGIFQLYKKNDNAANYSPFLSLRDIFFDTWNKEWIFAIESYSYNDRYYTPRAASGYATAGPTQQVVDAFEMANGERPILGYNSDGSPIINTSSGYSETGFSTFQAPDDPQARKTFNMWVNREPRFYVDVSYADRPWINTTSSLGIVPYEPWYSGKSGKKGAWDYSRTGYLTRKDVSPNSNPRENKYEDRPRLMFRYGEILLNYVEALNEYDPGNSDILKYLNAIRERAGVPQYGNGANALPIPPNQQDMRNAIHHERRVELAFENQRYFDTRRWLIADETDGGPFYGMNTDADKPDFYDRWKFETRVFHKNYYLFPIPQRAMDRDDNLVQNPGW